MTGFIPGVWDLLHVGHIETLRRCKSMVDKLVVGVPSDSVVKEDKGSYPVIGLYDRMEMLSELKCVDKVIPYYEFSFIEPVEMCKPDIVFLGNKSQVKRYWELETYCKKNNIQIIEVPRSLKESSSEIKNRCKSI